ncbi:MAG: alpha-amylase family glycosyl hydrolase [Deinococcales bacterium]
MKRFLFWLGFLLISAIALAQLGSTRAPSTRSDTWYANAVFYQVFVRSFQDSNGDGIGDLRGLTSRLDYLRDLGINALWLNPIHPSPSYHGYDITDYKGINPDFGSLGDFKAFLVAAKQRGIRVLLDYVPNHTARSHPWFLDALKGGKKKNWYLWRDTNPGWKQPWVNGNAVWHPVQTGGSSGAKVIFPGSIQAALGGSAWNPNGAETRAVETQPGVFELVVRLPKGSYEYKVAIGGTWTENYGRNGRADGENIKLELVTDSIVKFVFNRTTKTIFDSINNPDLVQAPLELPAATTFNDGAPSKTQYYYGVFWDGMPDLNWRSSDVREAMFDVAKYWLELGVDGFRVDAARYIFEESDGNIPDTESDQDWQSDFSQFVKSVNPEAAVVSEVWTSTETVAKYFQNGTGQDMGFNFDLSRAIRDAANRANPEAVQQVLARVARSYPASAIDAIFTSNHDLERMKFFNSGRYRSAAAMLLTLPGTPFIYYGEEIGMPNAASSRDEAKRTPMRWNNRAYGGFSTVQPWQLFSSTEANINVEAQQKPGTLWSLYKNLIRLRQANPALRVGGYTPLETGNSRVFSFLRETKQQKIIVLLNLDSDAQAVRLRLQNSSLKVGATVREISVGKNLAPLVNNYSIKLSPYGLALLEVK